MAFSRLTSASFSFLILFCLWEPTVGPLVQNKLKKEFHLQKYTKSGWPISIRHFYRAKNTEISELSFFFEGLFLLISMTWIFIQKLQIEVRMRLKSNFVLFKMYKCYKNNIENSQYYLEKLKNIFKNFGG